MTSMDGNLFFSYSLSAHWQCNAFWSKIQWHSCAPREAVFMLVMRPDSIFGRHAEKTILIGPILEGFVGGISTFNGVVHA